MLRQDLPEPKHYWRSRFLLVLLVLFLLSLSLGLFNYFKPLPSGLDFVSQNYTVNISDISFLTDRNYNSSSQKILDQRIFNTMLSVVDRAEQYILLDMFLFNDQSSKSEPARYLAQEFVEALIAKKTAQPNINIDVLVDPINTAYGAVEEQNFNRLRAAGVNVIEVDLKKLRDSNPVYSSLWRLGFSWLGTKGLHYLPHPFAAAGEKVNLRSYLSLLNFKADHRKILLADNDGRLVTVVSSANIHGPSSEHNNIAFSIKGEFGLSVYESEVGVARMSGFSLSQLPANLQTDSKLPDNRYATVRFITEGKIKTDILKTVNDLTADDSLDLAMFYLSDRQIIEALKQAADRGVVIRLILDPNKDAFGYKKNGIPNRSVACELSKQDNIKIRWYDTDGEQFHSKLLIAKKAKDKTIELIGGSANLTRRNLGNYNLEADVHLITRADFGLAHQVEDYFQTMYTNSQNQDFTIDYRRYADCSKLKTWLYRVQEFTGLASF